MQSSTSPSTPARRATSTRCSASSHASTTRPRHSSAQDLNIRSSKRASTAPTARAASIARSAASSPAAYWPRTWYSNVWAPRAYARSSLAESPAYSRASRTASGALAVSSMFKAENANEPWAMDATSGSVSGSSISTARRFRACQRSPSPWSSTDLANDRTTMICERPVSSSASGTRSHIASTRSKWVTDSAVPSLCASRPARSDATRARGRSWAASQWNATRLNNDKRGSRSSSTRA